MTQYICSKMFTDLNIKFPYNCVKNCCKANEVVIEKEELKKQNFLFENAAYVERKKSMLFDNKLPVNGCDTCVNTEPNSLFRTWNVWNKEFSEEEKQRLLYEDNLNTYEFVLSSACDLKCVYCAPKDSSSWAKELNVPINRGNATWESQVLEILFDHLRNKVYTDNNYTFFFSGGEPTYNPKTLPLISKILEIVPNDKSEIIISTNANTKPKVFAQYIDLVKSRSDVRWVFDCSIDSIYEKCEAIRYGIKWEVALRNIRELLSQPNVKVRISPTVNLYSVTSMAEFVEFFIELFREYGKLEPFIFNYNMVQEDDLSPMSMPIEYRTVLDDAIAICETNNIRYADHLRNVQKLIGTRINNKTNSAIREKLNYFKEKRPDVDWEKLFPHVIDIIGKE